MKLTIEFQDVCVHFGKTGNPDLKVPYRVIAPHQDSRDGEIAEFFFGALHPSVQINRGKERHGPLVMTIGRPGKSSPKTPARGIPSLSSLLAEPIEVEPDLAYGDLPPGRTCFIDLHLSGKFQLEQGSGPTVMKVIFTAESKKPIHATLHHQGKTRRMTWHRDTTVRVRNKPVAVGMSTNPAHEVLLGVLAINRVFPLADLLKKVDLNAEYFVEFLADPGQPGCSNSQWP